MAQRVNPRQRGCREYEQDLILYYYGECTAAERSRIGRHLELCGACQEFFDGLRLLLPLAVQTDEPPEGFWQSYSRDLRVKLVAAKPEPYWRGLLSKCLTPWPALATGLTLLLALTFTLTRERWQKQEPPPAQEALLEVLPLAENLDFFSAMDLLDSLDLLEAQSVENGSA
jgi:hypothetical protein